MSMMFPVGEQYFIDAVRESQAHVVDAQLREDIRGFIGQEATHRHLHARFNAVLKQQGLRNLVEPIIAWRIRYTRWMSTRTKLAIVMAYGVSPPSSAMPCSARRAGWRRCDAGDCDCYGPGMPWKRRNTRRWPSIVIVRWGAAMLPGSAGICMSPRSSIWTRRFRRHSICTATAPCSS